MNKNLTISLTFTCTGLIMSSCMIPLPIVGGGVAGGAMDPLWVRKGAENYEGYTSPAVTVIRHRGPKATRQTNRRDLLHRFAVTTLVPSDTPTNFAGFSITFDNPHITITKGDEILVAERISSAFCFSGLQVASVRFRGIPCLLMVTFSRASTGMFWIGLYREDGARLYLATMSAGEVWDVYPSATGMTFVGIHGSREIRLKAK